ncbi:TfuA domain-containing protein [Cyanobium sp. Alchichica 3B3-8F6]|uniref:TfuA-like protein n=1 Tax=Cyanobium sp. Alchichica 3B3-8F6 TaxID=2823696 RepID=UPI0020CE9A51|nr:TfuA domain-containing protein [Cyanobium sp. Alchichica 3B3-8F6]MCP9881886.1 TfuA domain-containing protein [Cyanobium sp. Alchichica 3B3-8F6]
MIYVFAGPSISEKAIKVSLSYVTVLPPIRAADILSLLLSASLPRPSCILILDGYFYSTLSVRHKEIIYALKQGIPVFGASSMGALRAAELADYGMVGIGKVYDYFASNPLTSDDEVAILHSDSFPYEPLSIPLVNLRLTLSDLANTNKISPSDADSILRSIASIHFSERTAKIIDSNETVRKLCPNLSSLIVDWKMNDALLAVRTLPNLLDDYKLTNVPKLDTISLGTHQINFFMDSDPGRYVKAGDSSVSYTPSYPQREASLIDLFYSLNLMAALQFSRTLGIKPSPNLYGICRQIVILLAPRVPSIPLNDHAEVDRLSTYLATLFTLYASLANHSAMLGIQKALSDLGVISSVFDEFHNVGSNQLSSLLSCLSEGNAEFADIVSKCLEVGLDN